MQISVGRRAPAAEAGNLPQPLAPAARAAARAGGGPLVSVGGAPAPPSPPPSPQSAGASAHPCAGASDAALSLCLRLGFNAGTEKVPKPTFPVAYHVSSAGPRGALIASCALSHLLDYIPVIYTQWPSSPHRPLLGSGGIGEGTEEALAL